MPILSVVSRGSYSNFIGLLTDSRDGFASRSDTRRSRNGSFVGKPAA